jgi:hypothetical protein
MLPNIEAWEYFIAIIMVLMKSIQSQGVSCYKCMTTDPNNDDCQDPFSSLLNPIQYNCQVDILNELIFINAFNLFRLHHWEKMAHFQLVFV